MDIFSPIIVLVILVIVILVITRPFFKSEPEHRPDSSQNPETPNAAYQQVLNRIHELDTEHQEGKISEEDYTTRREELMSQAAAYLINSSSK